MSADTVRPAVWAFGGGKGGVGKSLVCASVGTELAQRGLRVVALDVDFGGANLHTLLGVLQPPRTLDDFLSGRTPSLDDACVETVVPGLRLLSGAAAILREAHPRPAEKRALAEAFLALDADVLLVDLGAGPHYTTVDFFNLAGLGVVVSSPEPTSIQNVYAFLKAALFRRVERGLGAHAWLEDLLVRAAQSRGDGRLETVAALLTAIEAQDPEVAGEARTLVDDFGVRLVVNLGGPRDERRVRGALDVVCRRYLETELTHAGTLPPDAEVRRAIRRLRSPLLEASEGPFAAAISGLVDELLRVPAAGRLDLFLPPPPPELAEVVWEEAGEEAQEEAGEEVLPTAPTRVDLAAVETGGWVEPRLDSGKAAGLGQAGGPGAFDPREFHPGETGGLGELGVEEQPPSEVGFLDPPVESGFKTLTPSLTASGVMAGEPVESVNASDFEVFLEPDLAHEEPEALLEEGSGVAVLASEELDVELFSAELGAALDSVARELSADHDDPAEEPEADLPATIPPADVGEDEVEASVSPLRETIWDSADEALSVDVAPLPPEQVKVVESEVDLAFNEMWGGPGPETPAEAAGAWSGGPQKSRSEFPLPPTVSSGILEDSTDLGAVDIDAALESLERDGVGNELTDPGVELGAGAVEPSPPRTPRAAPEAIPGLSRGVLAAMGEDAQAQGEKIDRGDFDPWADVELASNLGLSPQSTPEPVADGAGLGEWPPAPPKRASRAPGDPHTDPPAHDVVGYEEEVSSSHGRFHVQTTDLAPTRALIRTAVYQDQRRIAVWDQDYEDLLGQLEGADSRDVVSARVAGCHRAVVAQLMEGGLDALPWSGARTTGALSGSQP